MYKMKRQIPLSNPAAILLTLAQGLETLALSKGNKTTETKKSQKKNNNSKAH